MNMAIVLTVINIACLAITLGVAWTKAAGADDLTVRARILELIDDRGTVRSRMRVEPDGEVVFRLYDRAGNIGVKVSAGDSGSGLVLLDETTEPAVQIIGRRRSTPERPLTTNITLRLTADRTRRIEP